MAAAFRAGQARGVFHVDSFDDSEGEFEAALAEAARYWKEAGVDLSGYSTLESARDIEDLRQALGAEKVSLWGISYGTHLALATIREMPSKIDRVVMAGVEGLNQTVKLPTRTDAYLDRLQDSIDAEPEAANAFPDLKGLMREVHDKYAAEPVLARFQDQSGKTITFAVGKLELQIMASSMMGDPRTAVRLPGMYWMANTGDHSMLAPRIYHALRQPSISFRGMPEAMDVMSGISDTRLSTVREQAKTSLFGDLLNYPMPHMIGAFGLEDLGDEFRSAIATDVRTLAFSGTLDGRTYPESAKEALAGFSNLTHVTVRNGGHNVVMQDPVIGAMIVDFMRGKNVAGEVTLEVPSFLEGL